MRFTLMNKHMDGTLHPRGVVNDTRMTLSMFQKAFKAMPADAGTAAKTRHLPPGSTVWKAEDGRVLAIVPE